MKIVCDCGLESKFVIDGHYDDDNGEYVKVEGDIEFSTQHNEIFIQCKCGNKVFMFGE